MKHRVNLSRYESIWGCINIRNGNNYVIIYNIEKNVYSLHKDSACGYKKICSAKDPLLLLKKCK